MTPQGFENIEVIDPYVEKGWSSEIRLTLATTQDVNSLEEQICLFPTGYREYVTTLGRGEYCSYIRIQMPSEILGGYADYQRVLDEYWFWEMSEDRIPKKLATDSVYFASTVDGDIVLFHPSDANRLFVLPRNDDSGYIIGTDLYEAIDWLCIYHHNPKSGIVGENHPPSERYFVPYNEFAEQHGLIIPEKFRGHACLP